MNNVRILQYLSPITHSHSHSTHTRTALARQTQTSTKKPHLTHLNFTFHFFPLLLSLVEEAELVGFPLPTRRQPRPHPRRRRGGSVSKMVSKEEGNSNKSINGGKHLYLNSRTRPFYFRRCKRASATDIESLPDELLSSILVRLPADYLHHIARLVCRRWSHIIRSDAFVNYQIQHSTYGLLFTCYTFEDCYHPIFVTVTQGGRVETSEFSYKCRSNSSCNGLVMREKPISCQPNTIYIANPATNQSFIPPLIECKTCYSGFSGIAYAAPSNKYKVTVPYRRSFGELRLAILTFGVDDSWRNVEVEHLPSRYCNIALYGTVLITEGFMHWTSDEDSVLTLDVETEKLTVFEVPPFFKSSKQLLCLSTGRFLSALVGNGDLSWEVWGMKSETGEWKKVLPDIVLGGQKRKLQQLDSRGGKGELMPTVVHYFTTSGICVSNDQASRAIIRLKPLADEKRERMNEEMIGKLKEMGNSILGRFGMSVDDVKDPNTGSYSVSSFENKI